MGHFSTKMTGKQCTDAGMAASLILLLVGFFSSRVLFYQLAIPSLVITMAIPRFWYPFAILWFGLSGLLGSVISRVVLSVIWLILVVPVGLARRISGRDPAMLKPFKKSENSVLVERDQLYVPSDLEKPY